MKPIALWAVPRSVSTALELIMIERGDLAIVHEPFFDGYETAVGRSPTRRPEFDHGKEIESIASRLTKSAENAHMFVKDMAYHVRGHMSTDFLSRFRNTLIIRHPLPVYRSLRRLDPPAEVETTAFLAQYELFQKVRDDALVEGPIVIAADDLLRDPTSVVRSYCRSLGLQFVPSSMRWQPGFRPEWSVGKEQYWPQERKWYKDIATTTEVRAVDEDRYDPAELLLGEELYPGFTADVLMYREMHSARIRP